MDNATDTSVTPRKPRQRLRPTDVALLLQYHKDGLVQTEIAQRLGCNQKTVSNWLARFTDSTDIAKAYLRGSALPMAINIVKRGRAADHIKALEGINVLEPKQGPTFTWQFGVKVGEVELIASTFASETSAVTVDSHSLTADTGSDKSQLC